MTLTEAECREATRADTQVRRFDKFRKGRWYFALLLGVLIGSGLKNQLEDPRLFWANFIVPILAVAYYFDLALVYPKNLKKLSLLEQREPRLRHWLVISRGNPGRLADLV